MTAPQIALLVVAGLFGAYLLFQIRPTFSRKRHSLVKKARAARDRAHTATDSAARATALAEAGTYSAEAKRFVPATGFFSRALREDTASAEVVHAFVTAMAKSRPRVVEATLWRRLGVLPEDAKHAAAERAMVEGLLALHEGPLPSPGRVRVLRRARDASVSSDAKSLPTQKPDETRSASKAPVSKASSDPGDDT